MPYYSKPRSPTRVFNFISDEIYFLKYDGIIPHGNLIPHAIYNLWYGSLGGELNICNKSKYIKEL